MRGTLREPAIACMVCAVIAVAIAGCGGGGPTRAALLRSYAALARTFNDGRNAVDNAQSADDIKTFCSLLDKHGLAKVINDDGSIDGYTECPAAMQDSGTLTTYGSVQSAPTAVTIRDGKATTDDGEGDRWYWVWRHGQWLLDHFGSV